MARHRRRTPQELLVEVQNLPPDERREFARLFVLHDEGCYQTEAWKQLMAHLGVDYGGAVQEHAKRLIRKASRRKPQHVERAAEIRRLREAGLTDAAIGRRMKPPMDMENVRKTRRRYGIP